MNVRLRWFLALVLSIQNVSFIAQAESRYVDAAASGANNGTSWANAYINLDNAIAAAHSNLLIDTIQIAQGTYLPSVIAGLGGQVRDRAFLFTRDGLAVLGGYPSGGGLRDIDNNITTLSGDIGVANNNTDNTYHILVAIGTVAAPLTNTLVIDGCTFTNGHANSSSDALINGQNVARSNGAGILTYHGEVTIANCTFNNNAAVYGGGIFAQQSNAQIRDCKFTNNSATINGGGIDNVASGLTITGCTLRSNSAGFGGGIATHSATSQTVVNTVFAGNTSTGSGGGVSNNNFSSPQYINCIFSGNKAVNGAAIFNYDGSSPKIINSTISGNSGNASIGNQQNVIVEIKNSIIYGNSSGIINFTTSSQVINNSLVQGITATANGNLNGNTTNPLFTAAPSHTTAPFATGGNYQLQTASPCLNAGNNASVPAGIDVDINGNTRIVGTAVDMGPYEAAVLCNLALSAFAGGVQCHGTATGYIDVTVTGGALPIQYAINSSPFVTSNVFDNLTEDVYLITVQDNNGCMDEIEVVITAPPLFQSTTAVVQPACHNEASGTIEINTTGGVPPYLYAINGSVFDNNNTFEDLEAGVYLITIMDHNECMDEIEITLTAPPLLQNTAVVTQPICFEATTGAIDVSTTGGTAPYSYLWSNASNTAQISGLGAGNYTLITTDGNGCTLNDTFQLISGAELTINLGPDRTLCSQQSLALDATMEDTEANYVWSSNNGFSSTNAAVTLTQSGTYSVVGTTPDGCTASDQIEVDIAAAVITADFVAATQAFIDSVYTLVNISDPKPDSVKWILPTSPSINIISEQFGFAEMVFADSGVYEIGLRTFFGACQEEKVVQIIVTAATDLPDINFQRDPFIKKFISYPNPSNGTFSIDIELQGDADISLKLINTATGELIDKRLMNVPKEATIPYSVTTQIGTYILLLETPKGARSLKVEIY